MAFHDDADDADDANDETSSEREFELPLPRPASSSSGSADSAEETGETVPTDLSEAPSGAGFDLDAALNMPSASAPPPPADLPPPPADLPRPLADLPPPSQPSDTFDFVPIDADDKYQRSDVSDGRELGIPAWAMAPAPDPNQAVPQMDAPGSGPEDQPAADSDEDVTEASGFTPKSAGSAIDDPYQIPIDYTTPDFFASRISRRPPAAEDRAADAYVDDSDDSADAREPDTTDDFSFDSLFATDTPVPRPAEAEQSADTSPSDSAPSLPSLDESSESSALSEFSAPNESDEPSESAALSEDSAAPAESSADDEIPAPPVRRSMADEELLTWADDPENQSTGTLSLIEVLEAQLRLREEEAREYREWETTLRSKAAPPGDPVGDGSNPRTVDDGPGDTAATAPTPTQQASPEGRAEAPAPLPAPLPAWDVPPPSESWAPSDDFSDEIPVAAHAVPAEPPRLTVPEPDAAEPPTSDLPVDHSVSSPELPADEDGDYDEISFMPPPLVEPTAGPTSPRSNLDEMMSLGDFGLSAPTSEATEANSSTSTSSDSAAPASDSATHSDSDSNRDSPFAFDLGSATTSYEPTDDDPQAEGAVLPTTASADTAPVAAPFSFTSSKTPRYIPTAPLNFDDLVKNDDRDDSAEPAEVEDVNPLEAFIFEQEEDRAQPLDPFSEVQTGSIPITEAILEADSDDAVDPSDRLTFSPDLLSSQLAPDSNPIPFAAGAGAAAPVAAAPLAAPPVAADASAVPPPMPSSTARVSQQPLGLHDAAPTAQRVFSLEESGLEPTPVDHRIGHAARLFWLWFAANSSIVSIGLGAVVFSVGMSLRQSVVAILAGVALSFIPLGLTTLAGKRSGQPTMVISRSAFGLVGNIIPALVALVARLFWGAVLLWVLASSVAIILIGSDLNGGLGDRQLLLIALATAFLVTLVIAFAGYPLFARIQLILSIISGVLVVGLIAFTAQYIDVAQALTTPDGSWLLTITGAVLVFSFLGLVWAYSGADIARYQRPSSSGAASALLASFGATVPAFVLIAYGALLAASDSAIARGFLASPLDTLLLLLPGWYPIPLLLAAALSLLSGITLSLYSGGFALQAVGVRLPRQWSIVVVGVLLGALAILFAFGVDGGINELFRDVATTLAVPTAAWAGIFAAETMIRSRRLDGAALTTRGGIYADVRWVNLSAFVLISALGFALTTATIGWLSWQGYGFAALGINLSSELAATDLGVLVALVLGILTPIVAGIPAIRRQEAGSSDRAVRRA
ncbi:transport-protein, putative permease for cytosine/purine [Leifsonia rubra CMS 76R]|nr:transport-protein, putative permease for cytosine/purine [Leifsonia rubra CMS 76R]